MGDVALLARNCTLMLKMCCHEAIPTHVGRTSKTTIGAKHVGPSGWARDSTAADPEAGSTVRIGRKSPKMQVTQVQGP